MHYTSSIGARAALAQASKHTRARAVGRLKDTIPKPLQFAGKRHYERLRRSLGISALPRCSSGKSGCLLSSVSHSISYWIDYLIVQVSKCERTNISDLILFFSYQFSVLKMEAKVRNYDYDDDYGRYTGLLDQGAEVFTKKMFRHSQAKAEENWNDMNKTRQNKKMFSFRSRTRRASYPT